MKNYLSRAASGAWLSAFISLLSPVGHGQDQTVLSTASASLSPDTPAHRAAARFRRGINLANYLEAPRGQDWGARYSAQDFVWIKQEGFDHVRLPIAWHHYAGPGPEFP